jgi:hypothetical protein
MPRKKNADYESNDGFSTRVWGPPFWHILRTISFNFPVKPTPGEKKGYKEFVLSLQHVLPCGQCRRHYLGNLKVAKFSDRVFSNRHTFARFMYRLEASVHKMTTGESKMPVTFSKRRDQYECFRAQCGKTKGKERGCIAPKDYVKSQCILNIVPCANSRATESFNVDKRCLQKKK